MQLEAGKKYTDRRGRVYGPLVRVDVSCGGLFGENREDYAWYGDGQRIPGRELPSDLVAEYVEPVQPESWYLHRDCRLTVLRVADGRVTYFEDGIQGGSYCEKERACILGEKITAEEAADLIRRKVEQPAPVESPDDWVTQDRVPARIGVDQENWSNWTAARWQDVGLYSIANKNAMRHGRCDFMGDTLSLRCRRKDLPPVPPAEPEFPKYYVSGGVPWVYTAYVKRNSNNSFDCIEKEDGRISSIQGWSSWNDDRVSAGDWKRVTQAEAEARVTPKPKTRTVVLKEWLCWEDAEPETVTLHWCSTSPADETDQFSAWDNAVETGNTRTVEIPVT